MSHDHDHQHGDDLTLLVTDEHLGVWIEGKPVLNPFEFSVAIVELARQHHFEVETEAWEADKPTFLNGTPTFEMTRDLGFIAERALDYLNSILPPDYYFDIDGGLQLFKNEN